MKVADKTKVMAVCGGMIPTVEIGIKMPLEELARRGRLDFILKKSIDVKLDDIKKIDVLICVRGSSDKEKNIVTLAKVFKKYAIYFLDDDLMNLPSNLTSAKEINRLSGQISDILKSVDSVWVTNEIMKRKYSEYSRDIRYTPPPAILYDDKGELKIKTKRNKIKIGYAGGKDHSTFVENILRWPIYNILNKYKDKIEIEFFGTMPPMVKNYRLNYIPFTLTVFEFMNILKSREWDIGLAPLPEGDFYSCKSYRKFLDYAVAGIAGIYSNVQPYKQIAVNKENSILCNNNISDWINGISLLIEDENLREKIAEKAYKEVILNYNVKRIADIIESVFPEMMSFKSQFKG